MESWNTWSGNATRCNASATSINGPLRALWSKSITGLHPHNDGPPGGPAFGRRLMTPLIRNGVVWTIVAGDAPENWPLVNGVKSYRPSIEGFELTTGVHVAKWVTRHAQAGDWQQGWAVMDSDTNRGLIWAHLADNGDLFLAHGGDKNVHSQMNLDSGGDSITPMLTTTAGPNCSGYPSIGTNVGNWTRSDAAGAHTSFAKGGQMARYGGAVLRDDLMATYICKNRTGATWAAAGFGTGIGVSRLDPALSTPQKPWRHMVWSYSSDAVSFAGFGLHHCSGAPRPICYGPDGTIYFFGFMAKPGAMALWPNLAWSPDYTQRMRLYGVRPPVAIKPGTVGVGALAVNIDTGYDPTLEDAVRYKSDPNAFVQRYTAQIAMLGGHVVVYQPAQGRLAARLWCFDVAAGVLAWSKVWPMGGIKSDTSVANTDWNRDQASQLVIAGDRAYVADPYSVGGVLKLAIWSYSLATGDEVSTVLAIPGVVCNDSDDVGRPAMREIAAADGRLVAQIDVNRTGQVIACVGGDQ